MTVPDKSYRPVKGDRYNLFCLYCKLILIESQTKEIVVAPGFKGNLWENNTISINFLWQHLPASKIQLIPLIMRKFYLACSGHIS